MTAERVVTRAGRAGVSTGSGGWGGVSTFDAFVKPAGSIRRQRGGMKRRALPAQLGDRFTVADARTAGVAASRLRGKDLDASYRGVRVVRDSEAVMDAAPPVGQSPEADTRGVDSAEVVEPAGSADARELQRRARIFALTMPANQFFTHITAAVLWGLPLPASTLRDSFGRLRDLDVGVFAPLRHPRHAGVRGHQLKRGRAHVRTHGAQGVRLTSPASTWASLGAVVADEYDLVAVGDAVVREGLFQGDPPPLATLKELRTAVAAGRRVGGPALRRAVDRVCTRSASRMETRCRLILLDAGLPMPELNHEVTDRQGAFLACVDLAYPIQKVAFEYEGEHHLTDPEQWAKDIARYEKLAAAGWFVIRVTKSDVFGGRSDLVARARSALRARS